jgi:hypothetical protein
MDKQNVTMLEELLGLNEMSNLFGALQPDVKKRLIAVFEKPTDKTWDNAYSIILRFDRGWLTLWQAWIATDEGAPTLGPASTLKGRREKWAKVPTQEQVYEALRYAATL